MIGDKFLGDESGYLDSKKTYTNTYNGVDIRLKTDGKTIGGTQIIRFDYRPDARMVHGCLLILIMNEGVTDLADRLHNSMVEIIATNELNNSLNIIKPGLMKVNDIHCRINIDDKATSALVSFSIQYPEAE